MIGQWHSLSQLTKMTSLKFSAELWSVCLPTHTLCPVRQADRALQAHVLQEYMSTGTAGLQLDALSLLLVLVPQCLDLFQRLAACLGDNVVDGHKGDDANACKDCVRGAQAQAILHSGQHQADLRPHSMTMSARGSGGPFCDAPCFMVQPGICNSPG